MMLTFHINFSRRQAYNSKDVWLVIGAAEAAQATKVLVTGGYNFRVKRAGVHCCFGTTTKMVKRETQCFNGGGKEKFFL